MLCRWINFLKLCAYVRRAYEHSTNVSGNRNKIMQHDSIRSQISDLRSFNQTFIKKHATLCFELKIARVIHTF